MFPVERGHFVLLEREINSFTFLLQENWYWYYVESRIGFNSQLARSVWFVRSNTAWMSACFASRRDISMAVPPCRVAYQTDVDCWISWQQQSMGCLTFWYLSSDHPYQMFPFKHYPKSWLMIRKILSLRLVALWVFHAVILQHGQEGFVKDWDGLHDRS